MNKHALFLAWAPPASIWSTWAKPVLFAHMTPAYGMQEETAADLRTDLWSPPPAQERAAIVVDLPGAQGVLIAVAWAAAGYRPVPLYNAAPPHASVSMTEPAKPIVDVGPVMAALQSAAPQMARLQIPDDAPPIFMLDADRRAPKPKGNWFDNRSISLTTDFPSASFLIKQNITRVLLVQNTLMHPAEDLSHTLLRYQQAGLLIESRPLDSPDGPVPIEIKAPRWYRSPMQRFLAILGLRRNPLGGFGGQLPEPSVG